MGNNQSENTQTVLLCRFYDNSAAVAARLCLENAGIPCFLSRGDAGGWAPHYGQASGTLLFVREEDLEEARRILEAAENGA